MKKNEKAVITIIGQDHPGILAGAATQVAEVNGNVLSVSQAVMEGIFTMTMIIDIAGMTVPLDSLEEKVAAAVPDMKVKVMHENIFNAMHTI